MESQGTEKEAQFRQVSELNPSELKHYKNFRRLVEDQKPEDVVELISKPDFPLDVRNSTDTPLHMVCVNNMRTAAMRLVERGAPLTLGQKKNAITPLHIACNNGWDDVAIAMIERGAPLDHTQYSKRWNHELESPLQVALAHRENEKMEPVILAMINHGAPVNVKCGPYSTLIMAVDRHSERVIQALVFAGAKGDLDSRGSMGSPLDIILKRKFWNTALLMMCSKDIYDEDCEAERYAINSGQEIIQVAARARKLLKNPLYHYQRRDPDIRDMYGQFVKHVLLPAIFIDTADPRRLVRINAGALLPKLQEAASKVLNFPPPPHEDLENLINTITSLAKRGTPPAEIMATLRADERYDSVIKEIDRVKGLSRCWHHEGISIPRKSLPLLIDRQWQPLLREPVRTSNGLQIKALTSSAELAEESKQMNHCVGRNSGYDVKCCEKETHILSIYRINEDGIRTAISTLQVKMLPQPAKTDEDILLAGNEQAVLRVLQHRGKDNANPPKEAVEAWQEFARKLGNGSASLVLDEALLGETAASKQRSKYSKIEQFMGYSPTRESVNMMYDRFRMSERAAIRGVNANNHRVYYEWKTEDGYTQYEHFIDGYAALTADGKATGKIALRPRQLNLAPGEKIISLRDLDIDSWLDATGLREYLRRIIDRESSVPVQWIVRPETIDPYRPIREAPKRREILGRNTELLLNDSEKSGRFVR